MDRSLIRSGLLLLCLSLVAPGLHAQVLSATLSGATEIPGPGDPDGSGQAAVWISGTTINFDIQVADVATPFSGAHIHTGAAGVAGPVLVDFSPFISGNRIRGSLVTTQANATQIASNPAGFYVNVHNADFPGGAVRGQLAMQPTTSFFANLSGAAEIPGPGEAGGSGSAAIQLGGGVATFDITLVNVTLPAVGAHIHQGDATVAGPIVVDFDPVWAGNRATGVVLVEPALATAIAANPAGFYVNVHTLGLPAGAVRGQLVALAGSATSLVIPAASGIGLLLLGLLVTIVGFGWLRPR